MLLVSIAEEALLPSYFAKTCVCFNGKHSFDGFDTSTLQHIACNLLKSCQFSFEQTIPFHQEVKMILGKRLCS